MKERGVFASKPNPILSGFLEPKCFLLKKDTLHSCKRSLWRRRSLVESNSLSTHIEYPSF
jgi:hypothetical protein